MLEGSGGDGTETGRNQGLRRCVFSCFSPRATAMPQLQHRPRCDLRDKFARLTSPRCALDRSEDRYRSRECFQVARNKWLSESFLIFFLLFSFCFVGFFSFLSFFALNLTRSYSVHANRFKSNSIEAPDHLPIARGKGRRSEVKRALPEVVSP